MLPALLDLGLSALGLAFAVWAASRSGSPLLALWCFFLVQALHVCVPAVLAEKTAAPANDEEQAFNRAHRAAEAAVRRMSAAR
jgi:hypothetical protein